ncbi:MAG: hypothetical protein FWD23_11940 [Oscillospiraceae bacterium]|nr:hypothetical protein [Oscillospiraceae bacterium]
MVSEVPLKKIIGTEEEIDFFEAIKNFVCQDKDVEKFLHEKAVDFDRRNKSRTYLLIDSNSKDEVKILGYYTITLKNLPFTENVSKSMIKRIDGYSNNVNSAESILLGQFGKDYHFKNKISGSEIMAYAMDTVYSIHDLAGCRIVFLECGDNDKIIKFYQGNEFVFLQKSGQYVQLIRYL